MIQQHILLFSFLFLIWYAVIWAVIAHFFFISKPLKINIWKACSSICFCLQTQMQPFNFPFSIQPHLSDLGCHAFVSYYITNKQLTYNYFYIHCETFYSHYIVILPGVAYIVDINWGFLNKVELFLKLQPKISESSSFKISLYLTCYLKRWIEAGVGEDE